MSDDDKPTHLAARPATQAYSRGFVRNQKTYVPGRESSDGALDFAMKRAGTKIRRIAACRWCHSTWECPPQGMVHPEMGRRGELCIAAGTRLEPTSFVVW